MLSDITSASLISSPAILLALAMWIMELRRKDLSVPDASMVHMLKNAVMKGFRFESCALASCAALVVFMCARQKNIGFDGVPPADAEVWQKITSEWPLLMTADSLLSIQSMLRLVMLVSTVLRCGTNAAVSTPLVPESACFMLLANICRIALIALSPFDVYHLDGPLGGAIYVIFEMAAFPFLLILSHTMIYRGMRGVAAIAGGLACAFVVSKRQQFYLADEADVHLDFLFSMGLILELPAALCFLVQTCKAAISVSEEKQGFSGFVHAILPVQQGLSLYFLLGGLAPWLETPDVLMRPGGHPFEFFWAAGAAQVVMYVLAAIVHFALTETTANSEKQVETHLQDSRAQQTEGLLLV